MDDDDLTLEELMMHQAIVHARIKAIEKKALARQNMTEAEKEAYRLFGRIIKNPELRDLFITMLILGTNGNTKSKTD